MDIFRGERCEVCGALVSATPHSRQPHGEKHVAQGRASKTPGAHGRAVVYEATAPRLDAPCQGCGGFYCDPTYCLTKGVGSSPCEVLLDDVVTRDLRHVGQLSATGQLVTGFRVRPTRVLDVVVSGVQVVGNGKHTPAGTRLRVERDARGCLRFLADGALVYTSPLAGLPFDNPQRVSL